MGALRVLSGVLVPTSGNRQSGTATVSFDPFGITGDANGVELNESGASGRFETSPGKVVSLRDCRVSDKDTFFGGSQTDLFTVNDGVPSRDNMTISWSTSGGGEVRELSVLIVGEA